MEYLFYDGYDRPIAFDDRTLAHLRISVFAKLRNKEDFALSWGDSMAIVGGRSTVWGQDTTAIETATRSAAQDGDGMVTVALHGDRALTVLVTPGVPITFETRKVADDGDLDAPFEPLGAAADPAGPERPDYSGY